MNILAQVIRAELDVSGFWNAACSAVWLVAILSSGCHPEPADQPGVAAFPQEVAPSPRPLSPLETAIPGHPMADWTCADSLEEIHAIWSERFQLSALPEPDPNAVWPYADAVLLDGNSWGMSSESTKLLYVDTANHAYQRSGALHPNGMEATGSKVLSPEARVALGWAGAQSGPELLRLEAGPGFRVAGPIRARQSCLGCHAYTLDAVVAVLLYDFQEIPDD